MLGKNINSLTSYNTLCGQRCFNVGKNIGGGTEEKKISPPLPQNRQRIRRGVTLITRGWVGGRSTWNWRPKTKSLDAGMGQISDVPNAFALMFWAENESVKGTELDLIHCIVFAVSSLLPQMHPNPSPGSEDKGRTHIYSWVQG